jgi:hypothetical protein
MVFLTDKDFDNYLHKTEAGIYSTEFYSIENYFCNAGYFEYVLRKFGAPQLSNKKIEQLVASFSNQLDAAIRKLVVPMAVLCAIRKVDTSIDFDAVSSIDFVCLSPLGISAHRQRRVQALKGLLGVRIDDVDCSTVQGFARTFARDHFNFWLRGKHGLQLVRLILRALALAHPQCKTTLQKLSSAFGAEALRHAKEYLGEIASLREYCET